MSYYILFLEDLICNDRLFWPLGGNVNKFWTLTMTYHHLPSTMILYIC